MAEKSDSAYESNFEHVVAFKAGPILERYGKMEANGQIFPYDVHKVANGVNVSVEIMSWQIEPLFLTLVPQWIDSNSYLIPYSGFCFPGHSADLNENYQHDCGADDHLFYQGKEVRGIELLAFGRTKEEALQRARAALLNEKVQKINNEVKESKSNC